MKSSTKKILKRSAIIAGSAVAGIGALVVIQKVAAKNGVSIAITPDQITPENETISKIISGAVGAATGVIAGTLITQDVIGEKKEKLYLETILKQDEALRKMQKVAEQEAAANNTSFNL